MAKEQKKTQECGTIIECAQKDKMDQERSSLAKNHNEFEDIDKFVSEVEEDLAKEHLTSAQNMSSELEEAKNNMTYLESTAYNLATLTEDTQNELTLANKNLDNMYEKLLKSNSFKHKCTRVIGTGTSTFGVIGIITGAVFANVAIIMLGSLFATCGIGTIVYSLRNLCKKPNSAMKNSDIEQGVQDPCNATLL